MCVLSQHHSDLLAENHRLLRQIVKNQTKGAFEKFGSLAFEIREMIFAVAAADTEARIIELQYTPDRKTCHYPSRTLVPPLLHACSHSRAVAKKVYSQYPTTKPTAAFKATFVNWEKDMFLLPNFQEVMRVFMLADGALMAGDLKENCQNLAIHLLDAERFLEAIAPGMAPKFKKVVLLRRFMDEGQNPAGPLRTQDIQPLPNVGRDRSTIPMFSSFEQLEARHFLRQITSLEAAQKFQTLKKLILTIRTDPKHLLASYRYAMRQLKALSTCPAAQECVVVDVTRGNEYSRKHFTADEKTIVETVRVEQNSRILKAAR